jgi:hypothetical protein
MLRDPRKNAKCRRHKEFRNEYDNLYPWMASSQNLPGAVLLLIFCDDDDIPKIS